MSPLSREAIFAVLSGLTVLGCDKTTAPTAEPVNSGGSALKAPTAAAPPVASATEVPAASGKPAASGAGKEKTCAPGGCAPGQCGANK